MRIFSYRSLTLNLADAFRQRRPATCAPLSTPLFSFVNPAEYIERRRNIRRLKQLVHRRQAEFAAFLAGRHYVHHIPPSALTEDVREELEDEERSKELAKLPEKKAAEIIEEAEAEQNQLEKRLRLIELRQTREIERRTSDAELSAVSNAEPDTQMGESDTAASHDEHEEASQSDGRSPENAASPSAQYPHTMRSGFPYQLRLHTRISESGTYAPPSDDVFEANAQLSSHIPPEVLHQYGLDSTPRYKPNFGFQSTEYYKDTLGGIPDAPPITTPPLPTEFPDRPEYILGAEFPPQPPPGVHTVSSYLIGTFKPEPAASAAVGVPSVAVLDDATCARTMASQDAPVYTADAVQFRLVPSPGGIQRGHVAVPPPDVLQRLAELEAESASGKAVDTSDIIISGTSPIITLVPQDQRV